MRNNTKLIYCPICTRQLEVPKDYIGRKGECPYCGAKFIMKLPKPVTWTKRHPMLHAAIYVVLIGLTIRVSKWAAHTGMSFLKDHASERCIDEEKVIVKRMENITKLMNCYGEKCHATEAVFLMADEGLRCLSDVDNAKKNIAALRKFRDTVDPIREKLSSEISQMPDLLSVKNANHRKVLLKFKEVADSFVGLQKALLVISDKMIRQIESQTRDAGDSPVDDDNAHGRRELEDSLRRYRRMEKDHLQILSEYKKLLSAT